MFLRQTGLLGTADNFGRFCFFRTGGYRNGKRHSFLVSTTFLIPDNPVQKPLLSKMITAKISAVIGNFDVFLTTDTVPPITEIARYFNVTEQSISRTYRIFSQNVYRYITEKRQTDDG